MLVPASALHLKLKTVILDSPPERGLSRPERRERQGLGVGSCRPRGGRVESA